MPPGLWPTSGKPRETDVDNIVRFLCGRKERNAALAPTRLTTFGRRTNTLSCFQRAGILGSLLVIDHIIYRGNLRSTAEGNVKVI